VLERKWKRDSPVVVATSFLLATYFILLATGAFLRKHKKAKKELLEIFLGSGSIFVKWNVFIFFYFIQVACPERTFQST
jgi:glucose uptake protein GlcU